MMSQGGVREVWKDNLFQELDLVSSFRRFFPYISIDTEFPGFLHSTPRYASEEDRYRDVKLNVDSLKMIQLGVTLSDKQGKMHSSWQFNLKDFDPDIDAQSKPSIDLLKQSGIDFVKNRREGVEADLLSTLLPEKLIRGCRGMKWITFHGLYDVAYLVKLIIKAPLPSTLPEFLKLVQRVLGRVCDVKYMVKFCEGMVCEMGLVKMSEVLEVDWIGECHQAGHDSLLTMMVFWNLKRKFHQFNEEKHMGVLYAIETHGLAQKKMMEILVGRLHYFPIVAFRPAFRPVPFHCWPPSGPCFVLV